MTGSHQKFDVVRALHVNIDEVSLSKVVEAFREEIVLGETLLHGHALILAHFAVASKFFQSFFLLAKLNRISKFLHHFAFFDVARKFLLLFVPKFFCHCYVLESVYLFCSCVTVSGSR